MKVFFLLFGSKKKDPFLYGDIFTWYEKNLPKNHFWLKILVLASLTFVNNAFIERIFAMINGMFKDNQWNQLDDLLLSVRLRLKEEHKKLNERGHLMKKKFSVPDVESFFDSI